MNFKLIPFGVYYFLIFVVLLILALVFDWLPELPEVESTNAFTVSSLTSFVGGVLLAGGFFILLRPCVKISPKISKRTDDDGEVYFTFKFVNSSFFSAFDVHIEAYLGENTNAKGLGNGKHVKHSKIELTRNTWIHIPRWRYIGNNTIYAPHCITVRTFDKTIENKIKDNSDYLEFRVTLKHAFSNLSSTYRIRYMNEDCICMGKFDFGNTFAII